MYESPALYADPRRYQGFPVDLAHQTASVGQSRAALIGAGSGAETMLARSPTSRLARTSDERRQARFAASKGGDGAGDAVRDPPLRWNRPRSPVSDGPVGTVTGGMPEGGGKGAVGCFSMRLILAAVRQATPGRSRWRARPARERRARALYGDVRALLG
jgi:hypothetical protein